MYYDFTVDIPHVKGKIITRKKGTSTYILFQYGQNYNAEKQYCIPQRTVIGKVSPDDPRKMYPNEKYPEYFPETAIPEELPELLSEDRVLYGHPERTRRIQSSTAPI